MKNKYRLYRMDSKTTKIVIREFEAETNDDAIETARKENESRNCKNIMWERVNEICVVDENGKVIKQYNSFEEEVNSWREEAKNKVWYKKIWDNICRTWYHLGDVKDEVKYGFERMFKHYDRRVAWSIDSAILDLIKKNVPIMIENLHGCPNKYVTKAVMLLDPTISKEEAESHGGNYKQLEVACAMWKSDLHSLVENCKLLDYYECNGKQELDSPDWVDPTKYPMPYYEFSKEIDYKKLEELIDETYNRIFDFLRENFSSLWD